MNEFDGKGISQLLLSPLYLLNYVFGTILPGALFLMLLGLKGNAVLREAWLSPMFGYKTKIAIFCVLAFVVGSAVRLPLLLLFAFIRLTLPKRFFPKQEEAVLSQFLHDKSPELSKMLNAVVTDGVLLANVSLMDRLSHLQADAAFHIGTGTALMIAACVPGDGSLRWIEAGVGFGLFCAGFKKAYQYKEQLLGALGIGIANILAGITPYQMTLAKAVIKVFGLGATGPTATVVADGLAVVAEAAPAATTDVAK
jgi:hypothetical protein